MAAISEGKVVEVDDNAQKIVDLLENLIQDTSVPRNVRAALTTAKDKLANTKDLAAGVGGAIYALEEVSNDINLPVHARTMIWNILTELESIKEKSG